MTDPLTVLSVLVFVALGLSKLIAIPHIQKLRKEMEEIRGKAHFSSIGIDKSWQGQKIYIVLANKAGTIESGYYLKGITVFAHFHLDDKLAMEAPEKINARLVAKGRLTKQEKAKKMAIEFLLENLSS